MQMEVHQKKRPLLVKQVTGELYFISFVGVDRNDIPLLMSVANCIDPSLPSSLTLIPMRK